VTVTRPAELAFRHVLPQSAQPISGSLLSLDSARAGR